MACNTCQFIAYKVASESVESRGKLNRCVFFGVVGRGRFKRFGRLFVFDLFGLDLLRVFINSL